MRFPLFVLFSAGFMNSSFSLDSITRLTNVVYSQVGSFCKNVSSHIATRIPLEEKAYISILKQNISEFSNKYNLPWKRVNSSVRFGYEICGEAKYSNFSIKTQAWNAHKLYTNAMHEFGHLVEKDQGILLTETWSQLFEFYAFRNLYLAGKADVASLVSQRLEDSFDFFQNHQIAAKQKGLWEMFKSCFDRLNAAEHKLQRNARIPYSQGIVQSLYILAKADGDFEKALEMLKNTFPESPENYLEKAKHISEYLDKIFPETKHCSGKDWAERLENLSNSSDAEAYKIFDFNNSSPTLFSFFQGCLYNFLQAFSCQNFIVQISAIACSLIRNKLPSELGYISEVLTALSFVTFSNEMKYFSVFNVLQQIAKKVGIFAFMEFIMIPLDIQSEQSTNDDSLKSKFLQFYKKNKVCIYSGICSFIFGSIGEKRPLTLAIMAISSMLSTKVLEVKLPQ